MSYRDLGDKHVITHDDATETEVPRYPGTLPTSGGSGGTPAASRAALRALEGGAGQAILQLPEVATEDDGGSFRYESTTPAGATVSGVTTTTKTITGATNPATGPIVVTTSTAHGLATGQSVLIAGVGGNTAANGSWLVKSLTTTTFELVDSLGNGAYTSGGAATYGMVTTAGVHGLVSGARVTVAGVAGATGVNATWWPVGYVDSTSFTIPCPTTGAYTSGGIIGDGGITIPKTDGSARWVRTLDASRSYNARWFGAKGDGVADDTAALAACIFAASSVRRTTYVPPGTYLVSREFNITAQGTRIRGDGQVIGNLATASSKIKSTRLGQRSIFSIAHTDADIADLALDCDLKASYGLYCQTASQSKFQNLIVHKAVLDGYHVTAVVDSGGPANNGLMSFIECSAYLCGQIFRTAPLAALYAGGVNVHPTAATGTVACNAYSQTIVGTGTNFLAAGIRPGDFICIGEVPDRVVYEIQSVNTNTSITVFATNIPEVTLAGQEYAIGVGDGYHEQKGNDNNRVLITGGLWRGNGGSGIVCRGLYGPLITKAQLDTHGVYGVVIGTAESGTGTLTSVLSGVYFEARGGEIGCIRAQHAPGLTIDQPLWGGASFAEQIYINSQTFSGIGVSRDEAGSRHWGGIHVREDLYYESYTTAAFGILGAAEKIGRFTVFASAAPVTAKQIPISSLDHSGYIDVDVQTTYNSSGVQRGRHQFSYGYKLEGGTFTLGTINVTTPSNQTNANVPQPTVSMVTVGSEKRIQLQVDGHTAGGGGGATHHCGKIVVNSASKP